MMHLFGMRLCASFDRDQAQSLGLVIPKLEQWGVTSADLTEPFNPHEPVVFFDTEDGASVMIAVEPEPMAPETIRWYRHLLDELHWVAITSFYATVTTDIGSYRLCLGRHPQCLDGPWEAARRRFKDCFFEDLAKLSQTPDAEVISREGMALGEQVAGLANPQSVIELNRLVNDLAAERDHLNNQTQLSLQALEQRLCEATEFASEREPDPVGERVDTRIEATSDHGVLLTPQNGSAPMRLLPESLGWLLLDGLFSAQGDSHQVEGTLRIGQLMGRGLIVNARQALEIVLRYSDLEALPGTIFAKRHNGFNRPLGEGLYEMATVLAPDLRPPKRDLAADWLAVVTGSQRDGHHDVPADGDATGNRFDATSGAAPC